MQLLADFSVHIKREKVIGKSNISEISYHCKDLASICIALQQRLPGGSWLAFYNKINFVATGMYVWNVNRARGKDVDILC